MTAIRVILVTVAGPAGHVDVGVRSDATPAELAVSLGTILGLSLPWPAAEHRSPPRPGDPRGRRSLLMPGDSLADAGVADGDLVLFRRPEDSSRGAAPLDAAAAHYPATDARQREAGQAGVGPEQGAEPHDQP